MDAGQTISILWQLAPYVVLEAGEVLLSATGLEFAFGQAPARLKSVVMSLWLTTIAVGHFLIAVFTSVNERFIGAHGAREIYLWAGLMLVVAALFTVCARGYRNPTPDVPASF